MKGLIIKDLMSFRKGLINVIFVSAAVLVFSVMVCISAGSGNLYRMMQENTLKTDEYSFPPMMVLKFIILVLMILPMVSVGDSITYLLREDKRYNEEMSSREIGNIIKECDSQKKVTEADIKDCIVYADKLRLEQVFGNIFSNSYKYADTEITVSSFFDEGFFVVEISDKGGGVPDEELDIIMGKFCRGTNAAGKEGSGIGLYISHYLIGQMGGELNCRNNGEGFTVSLRLRLI